jgi:hypothetical protein
VQPVGCLHITIMLTCLCCACCCCCSVPTACCPRCPQDTSYLLYPRINVTVCDTIHDDVGPTGAGGTAAGRGLSKVLLGAAVSVRGKGVGWGGVGWGGVGWGGVGWGGLSSDKVHMCMCLWLSADL